jgi:hypothetical protein
MAVGVANTGLKSAKQSSTARDGKHHASQFTEYSLPRLEGDTFDATEVGKNGAEPFVTVRGKFQGLAGGID